MSIVGWIGALMVLFGYYLNAKKITHSWLIWFIGNGLVAVYSFSISAYPTLFMSIVIMVMNIYGFFQWKKN